MHDFSLIPQIVERKKSFYLFRKIRIRPPTKYKKKIRIWLIYFTQKKKKNVIEFKVH